MLGPCPSPNFTQTPNILLDEWLPLLSHVELKVLMVIIRKTFGWHKVRDHISLSQLVKMTGSNRTGICKAAKRLQELGLIRKKVIGKKGEKETIYELVIEDSNNSDWYQSGTRGGTKLVPTKETSTKYKKKNNKKEKLKNAAAPIVFDQQTRSFQGITSEEIAIWQKTFPSVNIRKTIDECAIWAFSNSRKNYRKSIMSFIKYTERSHTEPFKPLPEPQKEVSQVEVDLNKKKALELERRASEKNRGTHYAVQATSNKIEFIMPSGQSYEVSYYVPMEEFEKKCEKGVKKMRLIWPRE